jgi:hypothetical protein
VAAHPLQDEPAEDETVSPLAPLLTKPQVDISLVTLLLLQEQHSGVSSPMIKHSNF